MAEPARRRVSYAEYLELEAGSESKHEWLDGEVRAMAGGKPVHALLSMRVGTALSAMLTPRGCDVYSSDLRVRIPATGLATYPDVSVLCEPVAPHPDDPDAATNPAILVEVLSPSTERWDKSGKLLHYQQLASLRAYVLVHTRHQLVECFRADADGTWHFHWAGPGDVAEIEPGLTLELAALYSRTEVPALPFPPLLLGEDEAATVVTH